MSAKSKMTSMFGSAPKLKRASILGQWWQRGSSRRFALPAVAIALSIALTSPVVAVSLSNARDMFYQGLKTQDTSTGTSVAYCLELHRGDEPTVLCNNRFPFKTGDAVRLHLKSSAPVYSYIALIGSSGKKSVLYPPPGSAEDNQLQAGKEYVVPPHGEIVFDDKPGTERLFVILTKEQKDVSDFLNERGMVIDIDSDSLTGVPQKVGDYSVVSNDGFYELGTKTSGSGLVYVNNPDPAKATTIALALSHSPNGQPPSPPPEPPNPNPVVPPHPTPAPPKPSPTPAVSKVIRTQYNPFCLHNDANPILQNDSEIIQAFQRTDGLPHSGINGGARDEYIAGLNHLYANWVNQQVDWPGAGTLYYVQQMQDLRNGDSGERMKAPNFFGRTLSEPGNPGKPWEMPGVAAQPEGMAHLMEALSGGKSSYLAVGRVRAYPDLPKDVHIFDNGSDLDAAWDANGGEPLIIAVNCAARMFQPSGPGGHVVVLCDRRDARHNASALSSRYEYRLLNSWGRDTNGKVRNGWVSGDAVVSAMNYIDDAHDESVPPERLLEPDALPLPGPNKFAHGNDGFVMEPPGSRSLAKFKWIQPAAQISHQAVSELRAIKTDTGHDAEKEAQELRQHASNSQEGLTHDQRSLVDSAVKALLKNTDEERTARRFPLSDDDKAAILHDANRMFTDSAKIYAQGLDQGDRNRALVAMLHDTANPEHVNQGGHNTCNVTTIMKVETFLRPAAQVKRFVDMYTNANGDNTVDMPL